MTGQGQEAAPHEVSEVLGAFHVTVYGVDGPWIDTTTTCAGSAFSALIRLATSAYELRAPRPFAAGRVADARGRGR